MPAVYMEHDEHGRHVVYTRDEVKQNEANGWRVIPDPSVKRKPGRPPKVGTDGDRTNAD